MNYPALDRSIQFGDGDVVTVNGCKYRVQIEPTAPNAKWGKQVVVSVTALRDDGAEIDWINGVQTDDNDTAIWDQVHDLIEDLAMRRVAA